MIEIFSVSFNGFHSVDTPNIEVVGINTDDRNECIVRSCIIGLPEDSLSSLSRAVKYADIIVGELIKIQGPQLIGSMPSVNMVGVSEGCGVIRFILNSTIDVPINVVLISACFDRARTPFGGPFSINDSADLETSLRSTPPWFDWRGVTVDKRHHLLICHGTQDINPSTPFLDAWGFFLRTTSEQGDVTLLQVGGVFHGYECFSTNDVHHRLMSWLKERDIP